MTSQDQEHCIDPAYLAGQIEAQMETLKRLVEQVDTLWWACIEQRREYQKSGGTNEVGDGQQTKYRKECHK